MLRKISNRLLTTTCHTVSRSINYKPNQVFSLYGNNEDIDLASEEIKSILLENGYNPIIIKNMNGLMEIISRSHGDFDIVINKIDRIHIDPNQIIHMSRFIRANQIWHPWVFKVDGDAQTRFVNDNHIFNIGFNQVYLMLASMDTKRNELEKYFL